jgi:hypothetical protein
MLHLGIALGTIAENRHVSGMGREKLTPFWPADSDRILADLFDSVFDGSEEAEGKLQNARNASLALRKRMKDAKARTGAAELQRLRRDMVMVGS